MPVTTDPTLIARLEAAAQNYSLTIDFRPYFQNYTIKLVDGDSFTHHENKTIGIHNQSSSELQLLKDFAHEIGHANDGALNQSAEYVLAFRIADFQSVIETMIQREASAVAHEVLSIPNHDLSNLAYVSAPQARAALDYANSMTGAGSNSLTYKSYVVSHLYESIRTNTDAYSGILARASTAWNNYFRSGDVVDASSSAGPCPVDQDEVDEALNLADQLEQYGDYDYVNVLVYEDGSVELQGMKEDGSEAWTVQAKPASETKGGLSESNQPNSIKIGGDALVAAAGDLPEHSAARAPASAGSDLSVQVDSLIASMAAFGAAAQMGGANYAHANAWDRVNSIAVPM